MHITQKIKYILIAAVFAVSISSTVWAQTTTAPLPILRPQQVVQMGAVLLPNSHRVTLTPRGALPKAQFPIGTYIIECLVNKDWVNKEGSIANGTVCTAGKREWDMLRCLAQYSDPKPKEALCKERVDASWALLDPIKYKINLDRNLLTGSGGILKKKASQPDTAFQPIAPQENAGKIEIAADDVFHWFSDTDERIKLPHWYYALGFMENNNNTVDVNHKNPSLNIADQIFEFGTSLSPETVDFDPYGYIFDATTLEPISNATVYLFTKNSRWTPKECMRTTSDADIFTHIFSRECQPVLDPTSNTDEEGTFEFVVKPGTYALDILGSVPPPETLQAYAQRDPSSLLMSVSEQLSKIKYGRKFGSIYKVIVPVDGGQKDLYTELYPQTMASIEQIDEPPGLVQRRDIPIDASRLGINTNRPVTQTVPHNIVDNREGMYVFGHATHPYTQINARIESTIVAVGRVNEKGTWNITIPAASIVSASPIEIDFIKPDFYGDPAAQARKIKGLRTVSATSISTIVIDPHPRYLDAIAQSVTGQVMPGTLVSVYDEFVKDVVYETKSDILGRYQIPPSALPRMGYHLIYSQPGGAASREVTVGQLLSENSIYASAKKVDMFSTDQAVRVQESFKATNSAVIGTPVNQDPGTIKTTPGAGGGATPVSDTQTRPSSAQLFTYLALLIMLVVVTILMVVFYINRHKDPHLYDATDTAGMQ